MNVDWEQRAKELQAELDLAKSLMTVSEAGKRGGTAVRDRYGYEFYQRIGQKGGRMVAATRGPEFYSEISRRGGRRSKGQPRSRADGTATWGAELRELREKAGLRQADVAASAGCTVALVSHVECGRRPADEARWRARYAAALAGR